MLNMLGSFIEPYSPRLLPAWNGYVQYIETANSVLLNSRYLKAPGREVAGIRLLRYILACTDWNYMLKPGISDYDKYNNHLKYVQEDLENTFETTTTGNIYYNFFHDKQLGKVQEYILPVEGSSPIKRLPFDRPWSSWKYVQPVRYLSHNSIELARDIEQDRVKFYKHQPSYAVITIDVIALVMKYTKFLMDTPIDNDLIEAPELVQRIFLHKYVLSYWMRDLTDIFLLKQMCQLTQLAVDHRGSLLDFTSKKHTTDLMYGFVGNRYNEASRVFYTQLLNIQNGTLRPRSLLSSPLLTKSMSPINRAAMILDELDIPRLRQFEFYRYLRDKDLFFLILNMYKLHSDDQLYVRLSRTIKYQIYKLLRNKIWLYIKNDSKTREGVQLELEQLNDSLSFRAEI